MSTTRPRKNGVLAVVVTHHPDIPATCGLIETLALQVDTVVVVDNDSPAAAVASLREALCACGGELIALPENVGVAAAQNLGFDRARESGATHVLLSDQDSLPAPDMVEQLVGGLERLTAAGRRVAAVGPLITDDRDPDAPLLFTPGHWRAHQTAAPADVDALIPAAFLLASGSLIPVEALTIVGGKQADWFIDWLDLEWGLRAQRAGFELVAVNAARLQHRMGERVVRVRGRARRVHLHTVDRNYYVVRNLVLLVRSGLLPWRWRIGYAAWLVRYILFYTLAEPPRRQRARRLLSGLTDGVRGRTVSRR